jgi:hypothetical protein
MYAEHALHSHLTGELGEKAIRYLHLLDIKVRKIPSEKKMCIP